MVEIIGLAGLRPARGKISSVTTPPYDVIKPGTPLESLLKANEDSLYHVILGGDPCSALNRLISQGALQRDDEPCFYIYEQRFGNEFGDNEFGDNIRTGVLVAARVSDYSKGEIIRHERVFDDKVQGRLELTAKTGCSLEPIFLLTRAPISAVLDETKGMYQPEYQFTSDFGNTYELHGIRNRVFRVKADSEGGLRLRKLIGATPLYIADGHHRYHAALLNNQTHFLAYIVDNAKIQAYNRVINGLVKFEDIKENLNLQEAPEFGTPNKHQFCLYSGSKSYLLDANYVPDDVVGCLDCSILERELYPLLGLTHDMIADSRHFDYYAESELDKMKQCVDSGAFDVAVALHPVSIEELMAVANAGLNNPGIVMPEKSTFFAPKILSGIFIYRHSKSPVLRLVDN